MEITLKTKVQYLKGVGPKMASRLDRLGIKTIYDLIFYFPRTYCDYSKITKIADLTISNSEFLISNEYQNPNVKTIKAKIINIANRRTFRRRFTVTEAVVADETGSIKVVWFNQPYLEKMLKAGREIILNGKVRRSSYSGELQMESPNRADKPKIVPVYSETVGISSYYIQKLVKSVSCQLLVVREYLPEEIIKKNNLVGISAAISELHQPTSTEKLGEVRDRMAFDELFLFSLQKQLLKKDVLIHKAPKIEIDEEFLKKFVKSLPFELTNAQKKAAWKIMLDLSGQENSKFKIKNLKLRSDDNKTIKPMNRLLNGDVGSGKTVVAAMATALVVKSSFRVALMAPTEILANQHYETLKKILSPFSISVGLISGSKKVAIGADVIVGTHALISGKTAQKNLGLVIIDEQHRFGVDQRNKLLKVENGIRPHFLSMTATPIPRTMSLVVFADLDVSIIDEMPADRKKIITKVVTVDKRQLSYDFIQKEIDAGHQAFVICPLIEESCQLPANSFQLFEEEKKTVIKEAARLQADIFPKMKIAMLHGKMPSTPRRGGRSLASGGKSKQEVMEAFKNGKYDILVSTSVVEVGVDIPGATVMMIENAEHFGLAQLHQFRGRVGRSDMQSYCFLFSSTSALTGRDRSSSSENAQKRLGYMESIDSGFELAEKDLKLRGPGVLYGYKQSGFWDFQFASLNDKIMIEKATEAAKTVIGEIEKYPLILKKISDRSKHLE